MELSLPFLTLRELRSADQRKDDIGKDPSHWADLSFLSLLDSKTRSNHNRLTIQEATTSVMICGANEYTWTGYAFTNSRLASEEISAESDGELSDDEDIENMPVEDLFATGDSRRRECALAHNDLIRDPRIYFLRCLELRILMVLEEWAYIVRVVENCSHPSVSDISVSHRDGH